MRKTKKEQKKEGEVTVQTTAFSRFYNFIKSIFLYVILDNYFYCKSFLKVAVKFL